MKAIRLNITHCRTQLAQGRVPLVHAIPGRQESHRACQHHNHPQTAPKIFQKVDVKIHIDRGSAESFVGNVYIGRVVRVLPGMQAAFVDIGLERAAFLYAGDIYPAFAEKDEDIDIDEDADATIAEASPRSKPKSHLTHGVEGRCSSSSRPDDGRN